MTKEQAKVMNPRERADFIMQERESGKTLQEIGDIFGVTRERIRQIVKREEGRRTKIDEH